MSESKFKLGDRVSWLGMKGTIVRHNTLFDSDADIIVSLDKSTYSNLEFYQDGRYFKDQRPSLKKLKKKKARYFRVGATGHFFDENCMAHHPDNFKDHWFKDMGTKKPKGAE